MGAFLRRYRWLHLWLGADLTLLGLFWLVRQQRAWANALVDHVFGPLERTLGALWDRLPFSGMELLVGLAAAGGLYVAIVKLCRSEKQVGLLFAGTSDRKIAVFRQRQGKAEGEEISRRIWGPFLIAGTAVSVLAILGRALLLQLA